MEKAEQERAEREESATGVEQDARAPGRGHDERAVPPPPSAHTSASPTDPAAQARGPVSAGAWEADDPMMSAMGLGASGAKERAPVEPKPATETQAAPKPDPAPGGGSPIDDPMMRAMGFGGGAPGGGAPGGGAPGAAPGGGSRATEPQLEGITTPPKGKPQGLATPETEKQLVAKKQLIAKAPPAATPVAAAAKAPASTAPAVNSTSSAQPRPTPGAPPPGGGGGSTAATPTPAPVQAPPQHEAGETPPPPGRPSAPGPRPSAMSAASNDGTVDGLIHTLGHDRDAGARKRAAEALGTLGAAAARSALEKALRDPDAGVAAAANAALRRLGQAPVEAGPRGRSDS